MKLNKKWIKPNKLKNWKTKHLPKEKHVIRWYNCSYMWPVLTRLSFFTHPCALAMYIMLFSFTSSLNDIHNTGADLEPREVWYYAKKDCISHIILPLSLCLSKLDHASQLSKTFIVFWFQLNRKVVRCLLNKLMWVPFVRVKFYGRFVRFLKEIAK